jgi:hypothetical protein
MDEPHILGRRETLRTGLAAARPGTPTWRSAGGPALESVRDITADDVEFLLQEWAAVVRAILARCAGGRR